MTVSTLEPQSLLTTGQVAKLFNVSGETVRRWARQESIESTTTIGGHYRFRADVIAEALAIDEGGEFGWQLQRP